MQGGRVAANEIMIVYRSEYTGDEGSFQSDLAAITREAIAHNSAQEITGILLHHNQVFVQVLEGSTEALETLMNKLRKDRRHRNIEVLLDGRIRGREFSDWSMRSFDLNDELSLSLPILQRLADTFRRSFSTAETTLLQFYQAMLGAIARKTRKPPPTCA